MNNDILRPMKIGINSFGCSHGHSGIGSYILSLVKNLPKSQHKFQIFGHELDKYTYTSGIDFVSYKGISMADNSTAEKLWHTISLNAFIKKQKYDAVLYPAGVNLLPLHFTVPSFLVVQEVIPNVNAVKKLHFKKIFNQAAGIISPSKYLQKNLLNLGVKPQKIKIITNGIDRELFTPQQLGDNETLLIQPFSIRRPYIIYASRLEPADKCHIELIKGFSIFKQATNAPHRLVIAGAEGQNSKAIHEAVLNSPFSSDILLTGYFPHENLPYIYSAADMCIFPSIIEGVGLPVIEAMSCGIPAAAADAAALPEAAGAGAIYFDAKKPEEIAASIGKLINIEENKALREDLICKGRDWVKHYDWKKTASKTIEYISSTLEKNY